MVFRGERDFLKMVAEERRAPSDVLKWDRGNDPKSIELFASLIYASYPGNNGGWGGLGTGQGEPNWAMTHAYNLDPSSTELFVGWVWSNYARDPSLYLRLLGEKFPAGIPKEYSPLCSLTEKCC